MHRVREVLTMACLVHSGSTSISTSLDAASLAWNFIRAAMINSIIMGHMRVVASWRSRLMWIVLLCILNWRRSIHTVHNIAEVTRWTYLSLSDNGAIIHRRISYWLICWVLNTMISSRLWLAGWNISASCPWNRIVCLRWVLWEIIIALLLRCVCVWLIWSSHVILFPTLWANTT